MTCSCTPWKVLHCLSEALLHTQLRALPSPVTWGVNYLSTCRVKPEEPMELTEQHQVQEFELIAPYLTGKGDMPSERIILGAQKWFDARGYITVFPYQSKESTIAQRHEVCEFFNTDGTFDMETSGLIDAFLVYKEEKVKTPGIAIAAAFVVFQVCDTFFVMVTALKVSNERIKNGYGTAFFTDVATYISEFVEGTLYKSSYIVVQRSQRLNPHGFYQKLGFVDAPSVLDSWRMEGLDLAIKVKDSSKEEIKKKRVSKEETKGKAKAAKDGLHIPACDPPSESDSFYTNRSTSRRDKHCHFGECGGNFIKGSYWARHLKTHNIKGRPDDSLYSLCSGTDKCGACIKFEEVKVHRVQGKTPTKGYIKCSVCNTPKRQDKIGQKNPLVICKACINKEQGSVRGKKKTRDTTLTECRDMIKQQRLDVQESNVDSYVHEQELLDKYDTPSKRANTNMSYVSPIPYNGNSTIADTTDMRIQIDTIQSKALSSVSQEQSGLTTLTNALSIISTSKEEIVFLADTLLAVCDLFIYEYAEKCIVSYKGPHLIDCINKLLDRVDMLPQHDMVGLLAAAFIIGQSCWQSAVSALTITTKEKRDSLLNEFSSYLTTNYDINSAQWFKQYWKYSTDSQIDLCKYFKRFGQAILPDILTLSLVIQKTDAANFVQYVQLSLSRVRVAISMVLDHIKARPSQPSVSFDDIRKLVDLLSSSKNQQVVLNQQEQLKTAAIVQWMDLLEASKTTVNIDDAISIQHFLDELQTRYGELTDLKDDITQSDDDRFAMILDSIDIKPNNKQFALAQYGIGKLYSAPRQLWVVPSGQGKSRISAGMCMIALLCGSVTNVHMVFPNEELMKRDQADFENLFLFVTEGEQDMISYHVGIDFKPVENALIIVDEADYFMFENPPKFQTFVKDSACICFTATPANSTVEQKVAAELKFEQYSYSLNDTAVIDKSAALMVDVTYTAPTVEQKAAHIKELAKSTPVLVYCDEELTKAIAAAGIPPVMIEAGVDHNRLRQLDKLNADTEHYTIIVSEKILGMRGFDYRSESIPMTLVIAKSFANKRDAVQGFSRVGRFGDKCSRERFTDVDIIDKTAETAQTLAMFKFVGVLKKTQVALKPVQVKPVTTKYKGKNIKRQTQLLKQ